MLSLSKTKIISIPWQIKLVLLMFIMATIPGLIITYSIIDLIRNELKSNINGQIIFSANSLASSIDSKVNSISENIELIKNVFENPNLDSKQKVAFLVSNVEHVDNVLSLTIAVKTNIEYDEVVSTRKDYLKTKNQQLIPLEGNLDKIDYSKLSSHEKDTVLFIETPTYNRNLNTWISILVRSLDIPNIGKAIVIAQINFDAISDEVQSHYLNSKGDVFVSDYTGKRFFTNKFLAEFPQVISKDAILLLKSKNRVALTNNYTDEAKSKYVTAFAYPNSIDWVVILSIPEQIAYSVVNDAFIFFSVFILISVILSIFAALLFSKHLSKPIVKMADISKTIAGGNFDIQLDYKASDSIGLLGNSLKIMGNQLKLNFDEIEKQKRMLEDYAKNLEDKVEQRTFELNESNKELKKAYKKVLELNEDKNEFLGIAAHDLKNPLIAISSFAEILREDKDLSAEEKKDFLLEIEKASKRMYSIVKNLLDINAIEQGKLNTKFEQIQIKSLIDDLKLQFMESLSRKNISLIVKCDESASEINADYNLVLQVLQNILSNAIKFSPGGKNIFLTVNNSSDSKFIEFRIKDEGPGFSDDDKKKLFQKFARLSARPTGDEDSNGLGLSIVKKLIELMSGKIELESEYGKGAEFIISFPKRIENENEIVD